MLPMQPQCVSELRLRGGTHSAQALNNCPPSRLGESDCLATSPPHYEAKERA